MSEQERPQLPKDHPLRCASCGDRATTTIVLEGFRTPACLRHYNVWRTPTFEQAQPEDVVKAERDKELADYLAAMDRAGGGIYTPDFRDGFRHALAMLAAYEFAEERTPDRV